jgi:lipopolysaccharide transport system permease protein
LSISIFIKQWFGTLNHFIIIAWRNRQLTLRLAIREVSERYIGQALGGIWALLHPMILLCVYYFLFSIVFKMRMPDQSGFPSDYFLYLLSGLAPWLALNEATTKGPVGIFGHTSLVKQVVFPIEILPFKGVLTSFVPFLVMAVLLMVYKLARGYSFFPGACFLPVALVLQIIFCTGLNLITSAVGVYFRDLKDVVLTIMIIMIYMMPLFYLPGMVPKPFQPLMTYNPLSHLIWCWQDVFFYNALDHPWSWLILACCGFGLLLIGTRCFAFLRVYFGNAL